MNKKIILDHQQEGIYLAYGLAQLVKGEKFSQCALLLTEKTLYFYDDNMPSQIQGDTHIHNAKMMIPLSKLKIMVFEKYKHPEYKTYYRLAFISDEEHYNTYMFFFKDDLKNIKKFIKLVKKLGVKTKKRKIKIYKDY